MATREQLERIGELMVEEGILTQEEIARAIADGGARGTPVAALLEATAHPRRADLAAFLAGDGRIPRIEDLRTLAWVAELSAALPEELARKHELVPVARFGGLVCVAKSNYFNRAAVQDLRRVTGGKVKIFYADEAQVRAAIDKVYRNRSLEIPAPKARQTESAVLRTLPPPEEARREVPLISLSAQPPAARPPGSKVPASKVSAAEYQEQERQLSTRLLQAWDDIFITGAPVPPVKVA